MRDPPPPWTDPGVPFACHGMDVGVPEGGVRGVLQEMCLFSGGEMMDLGFGSAVGLSLLFSLHGERRKGV